MKIPVILTMSKNSEGFYFYLYAKAFTICARSGHYQNIEAALDEVKEQEEALNLKIVERLPLLDHTDTAVRVRLSKDPKIVAANETVASSTQQAINNFNSQLKAAYDKL